MSGSWADGRVPARPGAAPPAEDAVLARARRRSQEAAVPCVNQDTGALLCLLAATVDARAVVEIGTGAGVSGLCLLRGMRPDGVLTTMDVEAGRQRLARAAFAEAGFAPNRARVISGPALDVLPRLADGGYDLVLCDGDQEESAGYLAESLRLLRPGGLVCLTGMGGTPRTRRQREVALKLDDAAAVSAVVPVTPGGLLCAVLGAHPGMTDSPGGAPVSRRPA